MAASARFQRRESRINLKKSTDFLFDWWYEHSHNVCVMRMRVMRRGHSKRLSGGASGVRHSSRMVCRWNLHFVFCPIVPSLALLAPTSLIQSGTFISAAQDVCDNHINPSPEALELGDR